MDNQHRSIAGYRELTPEEIGLMNRIKAQGEQIGKLVSELFALGDEYADPRWVSIGQTDLQTGLMALTRAVARPTTF